MIKSLTDHAVVELIDPHPHTGEQLLPITPSPQDWRDHWIYFLLVDRFNNPAGNPRSTAPDCGAYQGGTFEGIKAKLPYLKSLGVGAIWLSPVLKNAQWKDEFWGGYATQDFIHVEPRFCADPAKALSDPAYADAEFRSLVDAMHEQSMYVVLDIVLNHTADLFNYVSVNLQEPPPYNWDRVYDVYWRNSNGVPQEGWKDIEQIPNLKPDEGIWPKEFQRNCFFRRRGEKTEGGDPLVGDFDGMKELATDLPEGGVFPVRNALIRAYQYLIGRFDLDGFRIDTFKHIETAFARDFGNAIREYALSIGKKNFLTFGEILAGCNEQEIADRVGASGDMIGVDAAIDSAMFEKVRSFVKCFEPASALHAQFETRKNVWSKVVTSHADASRYYVTYLDNHDQTARFTTPGWEHQTEVGLTILMTMQGIPAIYYGTELGLTGHDDNPQVDKRKREYVREALWGQPGAFKETHPFFELIQRLHNLRQTTPALRYGRQYFRQCSGDGVTFNYSEVCGGVLAFSRILNDKEVLVVANSSTSTTNTVHIVVDRFLNPTGAQWTCLFAGDGVIPVPRNTETHAGNQTIQVTLPPMTAQVWGRTTPTPNGATEVTDTTKSKRKDK